jgi:hypothetical protein
VALHEMRRVLKRDAFALIRLPDLQEVARHVACGKLEDALYASPAGPISAFDILFGHRVSLSVGNMFAARHTGFTDATLGAALIRAGFAAVMVQREPIRFSITAVAFCTSPNQQDLDLARVRLLDGHPSVLYTPQV